MVGAINANHALLAKRAGFKAIYLSGGGVAAGSLGLPDLGITGLDDVLTDVRRITDVCDLPLLVDVDTGFGSSAFNVARTVKSMISSALPRSISRTGRRQALRPSSEQGNRFPAGNGRSHQGGGGRAHRRQLRDHGAYRCAGGGRTELRAGSCCSLHRGGCRHDFPGGDHRAGHVQDLRRPREGADPANITEFGATPLYTTEELASVDVSLVLYPLSAFRAMNKAAENVYTALRRDGTQKNVIDTMQTRMELYDRINYHAFEQHLDALFAQKKS